MNKLTLMLSLRFTLMGISIILVSFVCDHFATFLGDFKCDIIGVCHNSYSKEYVVHTHWGFRHWVVAITGFFITLVQLIEIFKKEL